MSKVGDNAGTPRAIVHKRILNVAADRPDASLADIAAEISGATPDLVERVLEEYGDPGEQDEEVPTMSQNGQATEDTDSTTGETAPETKERDTATDADRAPEPQTDESADIQQADLTTKQRETARLVHENPDVTQGEIADRLGVTRATVSRRLNDIPGFEWSERRACTTELFGESRESLADEAEPGDGSTDDRTDDTETPAGDASETRPDSDETTANRDGAMPDEVTERIDALESQVTALASGTDGPTRTGEETHPLPPELAHKVVHAAMESDRVSEEEELQLLRALLD